MKISQHITIPVFLQVRFNKVGHKVNSLRLFVIVCIYSKIAVIKSNFVFLNASKLSFVHLYKKSDYFGNSVAFFSNTNCLTIAILLIQIISLLTQQGTNCRSSKKRTWQKKEDIYWQHFCSYIKGQQISKQNCRAVASPKKNEGICFSILTVQKYMKL